MWVNGSTMRKGKAVEKAARADGRGAATHLADPVVGTGVAPHMVSHISR